MLKRLLFILLLLSLRAAGQDPGPFTAKDTSPLLQQLKRSSPGIGKVLLLHKLSDQYYYRLNRQPADLDQALSYSLAAKDLSRSLGYHKGEGISQLQLSRVLPNTGQRENGRKAAFEAIAIFTKYKEYFQLGEAYYTLSGYYSLSAKEIDQRIRLAEKSSEAFGKAGNKEKQGHIYMQLGDLYLSRGDLGKGLAKLKQSLAYFQVAKYKNLMGIYDLLDLGYAQLGLPEEAIKHGLLAIHTAQALGDSSSMQLCTIYNRIGLSYQVVRDYPKQRIYQQKALDLAVQHKNIDAIHTIAANLASSMFRLDGGRRAITFLDNIVKKYPLESDVSHIMVDRVYVELYVRLHQTPLGKKYADRLEELVYKSPRLDTELRYIYGALIPFYVTDKNYDKAGKYLKSARELALRAHFGQFLYFNYLWSAKLDSTRGAYLSALDKFEKFSELKDSVLNENKTLQIGQLEIIYEVEKKNDSIHFLTKQSGLQTGMLRQASVIQNITYVSIGLLLIIIALLIAGYRLMRRNNKEITKKQEEINRKNVSLEHLVTEKEWLIKEIHHRVKNNLHMVSGLLDSQSEYLKSEEAKMAISDSQHRIQSMSMIHQKLYQTENLSSIDMSAYINEMVQYLRHSFESGKVIHFNLDIERVEMDISHSIPLGLILNEAITNAMKYAFENRKEGLITITFRQTEAQHFTLIIADNGIGFGPGFDISRIGSFGLTLIQGLCDDIGATLQISSEHGVTIKIEFLYQV